MPDIVLLVVKMAQGREGETLRKSTWLMPLFFSLEGF